MNNLFTVYTLLYKVLQPISRYIKMYKIKKTPVYAYLFALFKPKLSDTKYLPNG